MSLREEIVNSEEVASFYRKYTLEDGSIMMVLWQVSMSDNASTT